MFVSTSELIDRAIRDLNEISEVLVDEVDGQVRRPTGLTPEARRCKEALQTIRVLVPKLEAVRLIDQPPMPVRRPVCLNCED